MFPGPLAGQEWYLFGHPVAHVPHGGRSAWLPYPGEVAALSFAFVGLNPDGRVGQVCAFPASRADALDDQQRAVSWAPRSRLGADVRPTGAGGRTRAARHARG
jgi:hypothetical protein